MPPVTDRNERPVRTVLGLIGVGALVALGVVLLRDRPGLRAEYFALDAPWEGRRLYATIGEPRLDTISEILATDVVFSVRWSGWWHVAKGGTSRFVVDADDGAYIRLDGDLVVDSRGVFGEPIGSGEKILERGFHRLEIGFYQTHGEAELDFLWWPPGAAAAVSPARADLFARRPLGLHRTLRRSLHSWTRPYRQLLGAGLLLLAAGCLAYRVRPLGKPFGRGAGRVGPVTRGRLCLLLYLGLFLSAFAAGLSWAGTVRGGDDTAYLTAATFSETSWFYGRYAHVYLLKLFVGLAGGDPFLGVRVWWSFVFAVTVLSLAIAVRSVGPGEQLGTLAPTLFVFLSQGALVGFIGAAFADYSAMMFVTLAVAVYLHGLATNRERPPPRREWHALVIGAVTLAAFRSKEVGAVLFLLPVLFLLVDGRLDFRRFVRRLVWWAAGAVAVQLLLFALHGLVLGDLLFELDGQRLAVARRLNFPGGVSPRVDGESWFHAIWSQWRHPASLSLRYLWIGVLVGAIAAGLRRRRLELRLLHLLPIAYLLALVVLYVRMPHPFSSRMLLPILPVAALMTGLAAHHAGLDDVPWRRLLAPRVLGVALPVAATVALVVVPYRMGQIEADELVPVQSLSRFGWSPDQFLVGVLLPAGVLTSVGVLALVAASRRARTAAILVAYLAFFGLGFEYNRTTLAKRFAVQRGELLRYPWKVFRSELETIHPRSIALSPDLQSRYGMSAKTRSALASLELGRRDVYVWLTRDLPPEADVAIVSRYVYHEWRRLEPALAASAVFDPAGLLVLVRPRQSVGSSP